MHAQPTSLLLVSLLATVGVHAHVERAVCSGAQQDGYCCNGSILSTKGGSLDTDNLICCEGDPHLQINLGANAPTSCTAGTEVPLKSATGDGSSQSTGSSDASSSSATADSSSSSSSDSSSDTPASSANDAMRAMVTAAPLIGAAVALGGIVVGL